MAELDYFHDCNLIYIYPLDVQRAYAMHLTKSQNQFFYQIPVIFLGHFLNYQYDTNQLVLLYLFQTDLHRSGQFFWHSVRIILDHQRLDHRILHQW